MAPGMEDDIGPETDLPARTHAQRGVRREHGSRDILISTTICSTTQHHYQTENYQPCANRAALVIPHSRVVRVRAHNEERSETHRGHHRRVAHAAALMHHHFPNTSPLARMQGSETE